MKQKSYLSKFIDEVEKNKICSEFDVTVVMRESQQGFGHEGCRTTLNLLLWRLFLFHSKGSVRNFTSDCMFFGYAITLKELVLVLESM